jgi:hypothetical protein
MEPEEDSGFDNVCIWLNVYQALRKQGFVTIIANTSPTLRSSNISSIPQDALVRDKGGAGPHSLLLFYDDGKRIVVNKSKTETYLSVKTVVYGGVDTIEIVTDSRGLNMKEVPKFSLDMLLFPSYNSLHDILKEMIYQHKLPLEWSVFWTLSNRKELNLIDGYTSFSEKLYPTRFNGILDVLIGLEVRGIGLYKNNSLPVIMNNVGEIVSLTSIRDKKDNKSTSLHTLIPDFFIWKDVKNEEKPYNVFVGKENILKAVKRIVSKMKTDEDNYKPVALSLRYIYSFLYRMWSRYMVMCVSQTAEKELVKTTVDHIFDPEYYNETRKGLVFRG